jgi:chorismate synthase
MVVDNTNQDPGAYEHLAVTPRPGHADYPAGIRYGGWNDPAGGGRFSGRITAGFVMAGAVAKTVLRTTVNVEVCAHTVAIGAVEALPCAPEDVPGRHRANALSCCDDVAAHAMAEAVRAAQAAGDSVGGVVECVALGLPLGMGEPVFAGVEGEVARALFSIPAVKAVEFGAGFALSRMRGSAANDPFAMRDERVVTTKNDAGGVLGGLTTGMPLVVRAGFKPTPSISRSQRTVNLESGTDTELAVTGRHDACIVPRAVVVVEAMVAIALCDLGLRCAAIQQVVR